MDVSLLALLSPMANFQDKSALEVREWLKENGLSDEHCAQFEGR